MYDLLVTVYIVQKQIQGVHPLDQPFFKLLKILVGDDSRDRVKGEELLVELTAFINSELDAVPRHQPVDPLCVFNQFSHITASPLKI